MTIIFEEVREVKKEEQQAPEKNNFFRVLKTWHESSRVVTECDDIFLNVLTHSVTQYLTRECKDDFAVMMFDTDIDYEVRCRWNVWSFENGTTEQTVSIRIQKRDFHKHKPREIIDFLCDYFTHMYEKNKYDRFR